MVSSECGLRRAMIAGVTTPGASHGENSGGGTVSIRARARVRRAYSTLKCASVVFPVTPLIGRMSWGQAENATTRSISARNRT